MAFKLGTTTGPISGNITTLQWIKPGFEEETAKGLGYHPTRLSQGYWVLLLTRLPQPHEFEFDGLTLRSGGKLGLPGKTQAEDDARRRVHDDIIRSRGKTGYTNLQQTTLKNISVKGAARLVKVIPDLPHDDKMPPNQQYPMGGGGLQWKLLKPGLPFLAAARVEGDGTAHIPGKTLDAKGSYDDRATLRRYLQNA